MDALAETLEAQPEEPPKVKKGTVKRLMGRFTNSRLGRPVAGLIIGVGTLLGATSGNTQPEHDSQDSSQTPPQASIMVDKPSLDEVLPVLNKDEQFFAGSIKDYLDPQLMKQVMDALNVLKNPDKVFVTSFGKILNPQRKQGEPVITQDLYFLRLLEVGQRYDGPPVVVSIELHNEKAEGHNYRMYFRADIRDRVPDLPNRKTRGLEQQANMFLSDNYKSDKWNEIKDKASIDRKLHTGDALETISLFPIDEGLYNLNVDVVYRK